MQISELKVLLAIGWGSSQSLAPTHGKVVVEEVNDFPSASFACCSRSKVLMQGTAWQNVFFKGWCGEDGLVGDDGHFGSV